MTTVKNRLLKSALLGACTVAVATASHGLIAHKSLENARIQEQDRLIAAKINQYSNYIQAAPIISAANISEELEHTIKSGENLDSIFMQMDLNREDLHKIIHANSTGKMFADVAPGRDLVATVNASGELEQLTYTKNPFETLVATRHENAFDVKLLSKKVDIETHVAKGVIKSSLFEDGKQAGLPEKLILKLADIFAWDIDFALNLKDGDSFTVIYEKLVVDGKAVETGEILSVEFINQGKAYQAVRFEDQPGHTSYYTPEGNSLRKAFLQTPLDFAVISSNFDLHRFHPILNTIRAHKGVDYSAPIGTPVKAAGDGKISFRGEKNGYGNVVEVTHGQKYSTLYAHLNGFKGGHKVGSLIKQGEVIGYVGKTGLATGSHLHYEFRIDGAHVNPVTAKLPHSLPLDNALLAKFKSQTSGLVAQLHLARSTPQVAQN